MTAGEDARKKSEHTHGGVFRQHQPGLNYAGLNIPVGRMQAEDLLGLAGLAERYGTSELRLGANQSLVIPHIHDKALGLVGGKLGSGGYRIATPLNVFVLPNEAVEVSCAVIRAFRDYGFRDSRTTARLAFLLEEW